MASIPRDRTASDYLRWGTIALGVGLALFSAPAVVSPRFFGRLAGFEVPDEPTAVAMRGLATRDVVMGVGLISAAMHGGRLAPWLLIRLLCDLGDTLAIAFAFARGGGNRRLGGLGLVAFGATVYDAALYALARRDRAG